MSPQVQSPGESETSQLAAEQTNWARREVALLARYAMFARHSAGRKYPEPLHPYRSPFQRDRDRILHSAAFRRLSGKMQVFTGDMGDYHRTRLTHTHEVSTIARTIGRVLRLNEDLVEALALVHDIGHPPFGHSGEDALNACLMGSGAEQDGIGFSHNAFALTLVEEIESRYTTYPGLNLSREVLAGQTFRITHEGDKHTLLEVQLVDLADSVAYNAHDVDDALTLGLLKSEQLEELSLVRRALDWSRFGAEKSSAELGPKERQKNLVHSLIDVQVADVVETSKERLGKLEEDPNLVADSELLIDLSTTIASEKDELAQFLFKNVYRHPQLIAVRDKAAERVKRLFERLTKQPELLPPAFQTRAEQQGKFAAVRDYIAGMTDRFCDHCYDLLDESPNQALPAW